MGTSDCKYIMNCERRSSLIEQEGEAGKVPEKVNTLCKGNYTSCPLYRERVIEYCQMLLDSAYVIFIEAEEKAKGLWFYK
jgi:hypothetical protein